MNDLFEKRIKEYAGEIFMSEPQDGHRDRFAEKLALQRKPNRAPIQNLIIYIATTAVILAGILFFIQSPEAGTENGDSLSEVQNYYAMQFENKVSEIEVLLEHVDYEDRVIVLYDIERMKTETARALQMAEEENIPFIVGLYSTKIEALEHIRDIFE